MDDIVHEDGKGNLYNDHGMAVAVLEMEVDEEMYPIESVTNFGMYHDLKPAERPEKVNEKKQNRADVKTENSRAGKTFLQGIREGAAVCLAQRWIADDQQDPRTYITRKKGSGRPVGRPALLNDRHKAHLVDFIDKEPALVLDQMMESLTASFIDLEISKIALYRFVTKECKISLKKAHFHSVDRNSPDNIKARKEWVEELMNTDMDYLSNCVFIDEAAFHINMKRSVAWSKVGTRAVVKVPKTRAKAITILGATSAFGVVNIKVRQPRVMPASKIRKTMGASGQA
ncbi:hypothetical protein [Parasitella parasitica]|uniref:Tc1-like transposase DDE domain-containing protein n=1 Tax=Parasitella parasitica TaxID=35722 RepID=A0A0B7NXW3_9FUNG|nr:hypothetical protein [Parasitella parasitica]